MIQHEHEHRDHGEMFAGISLSNCCYWLKIKTTLCVYLGFVYCALLTFNKRHAVSKLASQVMIVDSY